MVTAWDGAKGRVELMPVRWERLKGVRYAGPVERQCPVYLPPGYDDDPERRYPLMVDLVGFTGSGYSHLNWRPFSESLPERLDRLIGEGRMGPVIVALPDMMTKLGGNQYVDSSALGPWATIICEDLIPQLEATFRCLGGRDHRAVFGKSSGGYGALMHALTRSETWAAAACHSGDCGFELCYRPVVPTALDGLHEHGGSVEAFLEHWASKEKHSDGELHTLMFLAMAATYDADPESPLGFHLPFDPKTGEQRPKRWAVWAKHDPAELVADHLEALFSLKKLYIDCGTRDQFGLCWGARLLVSRLRTAGVAHFYEEFEDDHTSIDYRMDVSLPKLYEAIKPAE